MTAALWPFQNAWKGTFSMTRPVVACSILTLTSATSSISASHVHGEAAFTLVADDREARLELTVSAEVVLGREAPPRDETERKKEEDALRALERKVGKLVVVPKDCIWSNVTAVVERHGHHAEVELVADLECRELLGGRTLEVDPAALEELHKLRVSIVGPTGAQSATPKKRWISGPL